MLFKPDLEHRENASKTRARSAAAGWCRSPITLLILGGLGYIGWTAMPGSRPPAAAAPEARRRSAGAGAGGDPRVQDVPVYLDGVGSVER
jgi:multidrug efflux system membrane fusion protein